MVIGGVIVHPGDTVVGDDDGVLFIHLDEAEALSEAAFAEASNLAARANLITAQLGDA